MINLIQKTFKSFIKSLEVLYVIEGIKPATRILVHEDNLKPVIDFLENNNLKWDKSDFKIKKQLNTEFYSDRGTIAKGNEDAYYFVYVSKSSGLNKKLKNAEKKQNHKQLGLLLGYPECCCNFFEKNFPIESKKQNDYTLTTLKNSEGYSFPFYTNIAMRHFDLSLLSHFPCSFNCKASTRIAINNLRCIDKYSDEFGLIFGGMLKSTVLYTEKDGVFILRGPRIFKNIIYYNSILTTVNNDIYTKLKNSKKIEIINQNKVKTEQEELEGNYGIMVFI